MKLQRIKRLRTRKGDAGNTGLLAFDQGRTPQRYKLQIRKPADPFRCRNVILIRYLAHLPEGVLATCRAVSLEEKEDVMWIVYLVVGLVVVVFGVLSLVSLESGT
jgi:hypothetical protein